MSNIKWNTLINQANTVIDNVKKDNKIGVSGKWGYYFAKGILNPKKDITKITIEAAKNSNGTSISRDIYMSSYKDMATRLVKYVEENHQLPNNVRFTTKSNKNYYFAVSSYTYFFATILSYFDKNKKLPQPAHMDTKVFKKAVTVKKYGHATKSGCNNMGQDNEVYCGPHSMQEVIRNLTGKVISQETLASWAGTGSGGTGHSGIETALAKAAKELDVKFSLKWYNFSDLGWEGINKILKSSNQDCIIHNLYRNQWGHYEVINSINGNIVKVQNSLGSYCSSGCYCGYVEDRSTSEFRNYISGISQKSVLVVTRG